MLQWISYVLWLIILFTMLASAYYSFKSRREKNPRFRGLYAARMNICMGIMLVGIAVIQLFMFGGSNVRIAFGTVCLLLGLFNLFAGMRNHAHFKLDR